MAVPSAEDSSVVLMPFASMVNGSSVKRDIWLSSASLINGSSVGRDGLSSASLVNGSSVDGSSVERGRLSSVAACQEV